MYWLETDLTPCAMSCLLQIYQEIDNMTLLQKIMDDYLEDFNAMTNKPMSLVLFQNAIEHVARISRIISQPYGNALLVSPTQMHWVLIKHAGTLISCKALLHQSSDLNHCLHTLAGRSGRQRA
jgi:hypothetical protein